MYIICDIDGTLAIRIERNPYDMTRVGEDLPNFPVIEVVRLFKQAGYRIHLLSGRSEVAFDATERWMKQHQVPYDSLRMRPNFNKQPDTEVKARLYEVLKAEEGGEPLFVLDDRDTLVRMWRDLGLNCFQVRDWKPY